MFSWYALKGAGGTGPDKCPWNFVVFFQRSKLERSEWKYSHECHRQATVIPIWFEEPLLFLILLLLYLYSGNFWFVARGKNTGMYHELCSRNENLCDEFDFQYFLVTLHVDVNKCPHSFAFSYLQMFLLHWVGWGGMRLVSQRHCVNKERHLKCNWENSTEAHRKSSQLPVTVLKSRWQCSRLCCWEENLVMVARLDWFPLASLPKDINRKGIVIRMRSYEDLEQHMQQFNLIQMNIKHN